MSEVITQKETRKNLASILANSLENQVTGKRFDSMTKEKRVIAPNFLKNVGTFVDFRLESKNTDFAHFRLITDAGDEISLNALSLICYQGDPQDAKFKDYQNDKKSTYLNGYGLLQDTKSISKVITKHLAQTRAHGELELVLSYMNQVFNATPRKVYTYFPKVENDEVKIPIEEGNSEFLNSVEDKLTILDVKNAFEITKLTDNKKPFDILKSTYFLELDDDEKQAIIEELEKK